ncbi:MAG: flagellar biosynthesis regulator FlaF [Pseudomonadota bacterium]
MNAPRLSQSAYGAANRALGTPRSIEGAVLTQVTGQLRAATAPDAPFPALVSAVDANRRLWTTLIADLGSSDNALPEALRAQLISLGIFVLRHGEKVVRREAEAGPILEINAAVIRGLRGDPVGDPVVAVATS